MEYIDFASYRNIFFLLVSLYNVSIKLKINVPNCAFLSPCIIYILLLCIHIISFYYNTHILNVMLRFITKQLKGGRNDKSLFANWLQHH